MPEELATVWRDWQEELPYITNHPVPRCYYHPGKVRRHTQIHGFADASNVAYGGVAYLRTLYEDTTVTVNIILAKMKVAPLSPSGTTPRLELCGVQMLSKLLITAMEALDIPLQDVFARSDSTFILCWLHMPQERMNTYVSNRQCPGSQQNTGDMFLLPPTQQIWPVKAWVQRKSQSQDYGGRDRNGSYSAQKDGPPGQTGGGRTVICQSSGQSS